MIPLADAQAWLRERLRLGPPETIPFSEAAGRILAADAALSPRPPFPAALVDGLAVRAADTEGASDYAPLSVRGVSVKAGDRLPANADAVLPTIDGDTHARAAVAPGHGVAPVGHDVPHGAVLRAGTPLVPLHLALLGADPLVLARPRVAAAALLNALVRAEGGQADMAAPGLVLTECPLTSIDHAAVAIRPGETTALGHIGLVPAIRLPTHPAAQATVFSLLVAPILRRLAGRAEPVPIPAILARKITSQLGQLDAVRVRAEGGTAVPLGPADTIGLLAAASATGLVLVPEGSEGYPAGATVPIYPLCPIYPW